MNKRPRPCPRCGSGAVKIVTRGRKSWAHCIACQLSGNERPSATEALEAWNSAADTADALRRCS